MGGNAVRTAGSAPNGRATTTTSGVAARALDRPRGAVKSGYIIGPGADLLFIILCSLWALALGFVAGRVLSQADQFMFFAVQVSLIVAFQTTLTHAHPVIVFSRSHANPNIFRQFPRRFTVVPAAVLVVQLVSHWVLLVAVAVTVLWDVYHLAMQTFGFGRIYDARRGIDPEHGREVPRGAHDGCAPARIGLPRVLRCLAAALGARGHSSVVASRALRVPGSAGATSTGRAALHGGCSRW